MRPMLFALLFALPISSLAAQHVLLKVDGPTAGELFGRAVDALGDVTGDGIPDVIAGAPFASPNMAQSGYVQVLDGATGQVVFLINGAQNGSMLGTSVASTGDVDMDGVPDFLAGAPLVLPPLPGGPPNPPGQVFLYSGATGQVLHTFASPNIGDGYGRSVDGGFDVDGDGRADAVIGADFGNFAEVRSGATGALVHTFVGDTAGDFFGYSVALLDDQDGDALAEIAVGARLDDNTGTDAGMVRVFAGATGAVMYSFDGDAAGDGLGYSLAGAADVDGDGVPDLIAGARGDDDGGLDAGSARVFSGATGAILYTFHGEAAGDGLGITNSVDGAGDANFDGRADLLLASALNDGHGTSAGRVRVMSGSTGQLIAAMDGDGADFLLGVTARGGADFNQDGLADAVLGAFGDDLVGGANSGHLRIVTTCPDADAVGYGAGWPGSSGVPSLTAPTPPVLGASMSIQIGNSLGSSTTALLAIGLTSASLATPYGGTLLVVPIPFLTLTLPLPGAGLSLNATLPSSGALCGQSVYLQALEVDAGASKGISFTPGLQLLFGL